MSLQIYMQPKLKVKATLTSQEMHHEGSSTTFQSEVNLDAANKYEASHTRTATDQLLSKECYKPAATKCPLLCLLVSASGKMCST